MGNLNKYLFFILLICIFKQNIIIMLSETEYLKLRTHLEKIVTIIPTIWGRMQSKDLDRRLSNFYEYEDYNELNKAIQQSVNRGVLPDNNSENNYYRHRWFVYKCSLIDEYLFYKQLETFKEYNDFIFNSFKFKGVVILPTLKNKWKVWFKNPLSLIDYLYKEQQKSFYSSRKLENRLFIAYHPADITKEQFLRADFSSKTNIFKEYIQNVLDGKCNLYDYMNSRKTDIIIISQNEAGSVFYGFGSENQNGELLTKTI